MPNSKSCRAHVINLTHTHTPSYRSKQVKVWWDNLGKVRGGDVALLCFQVSEEGLRVAPAKPKKAKRGKDEVATKAPPTIDTKKTVVAAKSVPHDTAPPPPPPASKEESVRRATDAANRTMASMVAASGPSLKVADEEEGELEGDDTDTEAS